MMRIPILACLTALLLAAPASATFLVNGDFETGDLTGWTTFTTDDGVISPPAGVESFETVEGIDSLAARFNAGQGAGVIDMDFEGGGIEQDVFLEAGDYQLSADIALDVEGSVGSLADFVFELLFQGAIVDAVQFEGINVLQVKRATLSESLTNLAAGTYTVAIEIRSDAGVGFARQWVDNVTLIPEPSTAALMTLGLVGLAARRRS